MTVSLRTFTAALLAAGSLTLAYPASAQDCDRTCLEGWVDSYLDALAKHDTDAVKLADDVRFTANGQRLEVGDGIWRTFKAKGKFSIVVADVPAQQVGAIITFAEEGPEGAGGALGVRLKIRNGEIVEIEQRETHDPEVLALMDATPVRPAFARAVTPAEHMSRRDLARIADAYFGAIQLNDGKGFYPVGDDCDRYTNGMHATNVPTPAGETRPDPKTSTVLTNQWSCREQFESGLLHFVNRVRDRRIVAIDQERGLVFALGFFDHSAGDTRTFTIPDGRTVTAGPTTPFTWSIVEIFKITGGLIHEIQALELERPYAMTSGWGSWEDNMSDKPRDETGVPYE
ncbi:MAG TPA: hypothetical protein VNR60_12710 [Croceibacterium sp.]|nr:hypothetical protein [Croceibacterium sp.]